MKRGIAMLPSLLTLGNFTCGFFSIVLSLNAVFLHARLEGHRDVGAPKAPPADFLEEAFGDDVAPDAKAAHRERMLHDVEYRLQYRARWLLTAACLIVFLGMFFDMLDGRVARMTGTDSRFGAELDSLADICTFGIAPAVAVTAHWLMVQPPGKSWWGQVMIFGAVYAACAALRLARYNVETGSIDKNYFRGLPSPAAGGCVVGAVLFLNRTDCLDGLWTWLAQALDARMTPDELGARALAGYMVLFGYLMVSGFWFTHVVNRYLGRRRGFPALVLCVFGAAVLWHAPWHVIFLAFNGYAVACLVGNLFRYLRHRQPPLTAAGLAEEAAAAEDDDDDADAAR